MRRDGETTKAFENHRPSVLHAFLNFVALGSINTENGHEIQVHIKKRRKMICKNYGHMIGGEWIDELPVRSITYRPDEIIINV